MPAVKTPRKPRVTRRDRAEATRRRIVDAAGTLFRDVGYPDTTMAAIAQRAGVAVQTVYFTFHTKTALLAAVADAAITGGRADAPEQTPWVQAALSARDGRRQIAAIVEGTAGVIPRMLPVVHAWYAAMSTDAAAGQQFRERLLARRAFLRRIVGMLRDRAELRRGLDPERATDIFFALTTPELYDNAIHVLGWTVDEWKTWVTNALVRELLSS